MLYSVLHWLRKNLGDKVATQTGNDVRTPPTARRTDQFHTPPLQKRGTLKDLFTPVRHPVQPPKYLQPSTCQYMISISGLVVGILFLLAGVFAFCSIKGFLPPNADSLKKFSVIGLTNSYFIIGGGTGLTLLSCAATVYLFRKLGEHTAHAKS